MKVSSKKIEKEMKSTLLSIVIVAAVLMSCLAGIIMFSANVRAQTVHRGHITQDEVWTPQGNPHYVVSSVTVDQGVTLEIQPGTQVYFDQDTGLYVEGNLTVSVTDALDPQVLFTSNASSPSSADWHGIQFNETADDYSVIRGSIIQYAYVGIWLYHASPYVFQWSEIRYNSWGIFSWFGTPWVWNNSIHHNDGDGIQIGGFDWYRPDNPHDPHWPDSEPIPVYIEENDIANNGMRGIKFYDQGMGEITPFNISFNNISGNGWRGISVFTGSGVVYDNDITSNDGGIGFLEEYTPSEITITHNNLTNNGELGIAVTYGDATIENNSLDQHDVWGVYLHDCNAYLANNTIQHTEYMDGPGHYYGYGLQITDSAVHLRNNDILYNARGIRIRGGDSDVVVAYSNVSSNRYTGISMHDYSWTEISNAILYGNGYDSDVTTYAIYMVGGSNGTIMFNEITHNGIGVSLRDGAKPETRNNTIENNTNGIEIIGGGTHPEIVNNSVVNNSFCGIRLNDGGNATVHGNNIYDNEQYGMYNSDDSIMVNATHNWWGHDTGPHNSASNPYGQGDEVSNYIDFDPWLHNPAF